MVFESVNNPEKSRAYFALPRARATVGRSGKIKERFRQIWENRVYNNRSCGFNAVKKNRLKLRKKKTDEIRIRIFKNIRKNQR